MDLGRDPKCVMDQIACIGFVSSASSAGYWVGLMGKVCAADGGKSCTQVTDPEKGVEYDEIHVQVSLLRCGTGF